MFKGLWLTKISRQRVCSADDAKIRDCVWSYLRLSQLLSLLEAMDVVNSYSETQLLARTQPVFSLGKSMS